VSDWPGPERNPAHANPVVRLLRRYAPFLAIVVAITLIAVFLPGGGNGGSRATSTTQPSTSGSGTTSNGLRLTFDQARAAGTNVNWGPTCDTSTGRVAVPFSYAPPCVVPWKGGDNGGATAPGVTGDTITIAVYQEQPDLLQETFLQQSGSDQSLNAELATEQQYVDFFESHYQMYGRKVRLVPIKASGAADDDVAAKADAIKVATEIHAFASFGGPSQTSAYADELAARGVMCLGDCTIAQPESFIRSRSPYIWPLLAAPEQAAEHWAAFVAGGLANRPASYAGDPALRRQRRRFGVVRYDDDAGSFRRSFTVFRSLLAQRGVHLATEIPYQLDLLRAQESARAVIAKLKADHVTTVLLAGDPIFPSFLTKEATAQNYFPEWAVMGYAYTDTAVFGRTYDQRQWAHAFGVSLLPARTSGSADQFSEILVWQSGKPPIASTYQALVQAPLILFTGLHLAGAALTADRFRRALDSFPADRPLQPTTLHLSWGRHGIWPGVDDTGGDDATVIWWDPNARGPDEVGSVGRGLYRYALSGRRYLPRGWPRRSSLGLYDTARSTTVITALPPGQAPPAYPSPAGARSARRSAAHPALPPRSSPAR
jgi:hypothetical protein